MGFVNVGGGGSALRWRRTAVCCAAGGEEVTDKVIPFKKPVFPFGDFDIFLDSENYSRRNYETYGDVLRIRAPFLGEMIAIRGMNFVEALLQDEVAVSRGSYPYTFQELLEEDNFSFLSGEEHAKGRRMFAPVFSRSSVAQMVELANSETAKSVETMVGSDGVKMAYKHVRKLAFRNMLTCLIGVSDPGELEGHYDTFCQFLDGMFTMPINFPGTTWNKALSAKKKLREALRGYVQERRAQLAEMPDDEEGPADSLTILLRSKDEMGLIMSDDDVLVNLMLIMLAGFETIAATMTRITQVLTEPDSEQIVRKLREEILPLGDGKLDMKAVMSLEETNLFLLEIYRRYSAIPGLFRVMVKDTKVDGYRFEKGEVVLLSIIDTNLDEKTWPAPFLFNPERHRNRQKDSSVHNAIFGAGEHNCLGRHFAELTLKLYIIHMVRAMERRSITLVPDQVLQRGGETVNRPKSGCMIQVADLPTSKVPVEEPSKKYTEVR